MDKKNTLLVFLGSLLLYQTIFTENNQRLFSIYIFLNNLSHAAWTSFFFVTRIIGALLMGNILYCIQAFILLSLVIAIESYTLHKLIKVTYSRAVWRMAMINIIHTIIALLIILFNMFRILIMYKYVGIFVLLGIRILVSYFIYAKIDTQINKKLLKKSIAIANSVSFACITIIILLFRM